jgi:hypothetical protein
MNLLELRRGELYEIAKKSYDVVYNNIMSRGKMHQKPTFLGDLNKSSLKREHFSDLIQNDYLVSLRSDDSYLMLIGEVDVNNSEARYIFFISRGESSNLTYFTIEDLPSIRGCAQMLFDGELLINDKKAIYIANDLLYGPSTPTFEDETSRLKLNLGASFAMIGPKANTRWPFYKRYDILKKVILNEYSPISQYIRGGEAFSMIVSPYFSAKELFSNSTDVSDVYRYIAKQYIAKQYIAKQRPAKGHELVFRRFNDLCKNNVYSYTARSAAASVGDDSIDLKLLCVVFNKPSDKWGAFYKNRIVKQLMGTTFEYRCRLSKNPCKLLDDKTFGLIQNFVDQRALSYTEERTKELSMSKRIARIDEIETKLQLRLAKPENCVLLKIFKVDTAFPDISDSVVHYYKEGVEITYAILGNHRIKDEILKKTLIHKLTPPRNEIMQRCGYDLDLVTYATNELILPKYPESSRPYRYRYQKKYEIYGMPENHTPNILWRLDVSIYGDSPQSEDLAKKKFNEDPVTEIAIKYAPGGQEMNALAYKNIYGEAVGEQIYERIKKIQNLPTSVVMQDYFRSLYWLLNIIFD